MPMLIDGDNLKYQIKDKAIRDLIGSQPCLCVQRNGQPSFL